jgi:hypothetical protein
MSEWTGWRSFPVETRREDLSKLGTGRHPGRHVSEVIRQMKIAVGENVSSIPGEAPWLRATVGFAWEWALELVASGASIEAATETAFKRLIRKNREGVVKQITLELDDIHGTPDAISPDEGCLESYKATWRSSRGCDTLEGFEDKFWTWHMQEKGYLKMWNATYPDSPLYSCNWFVLWVCGDYSRPIGPRAEECVVTWEQSELDQAWEAMLSHADGMDEKEME